MANSILTISRNLPAKGKRKLKYLSLWKTVESSVTDVKKAVVKAKILTGTYILHCRLKEED